MYILHAATQIARDFAIKAHRDTNHMYGDKHYDEGHLQKVFDIGFQYKSLIKNTKEDKYVLGACWTHDTIEDTRQTYSDVKKACGKKIAELTLACTQSTGKTRADRQDAAYYARINECEYAVFVKLCDRIANVRNCVEIGDGMFTKYRDEHAPFRAQLFNENYLIMWDELDQLLGLNK